MKALRLFLAAASYGAARAGTRFWTAVAYVRLRAHGATIGRGLRVRGPIRLHCHRTGSIRIGAPAASSRVSRATPSEATGAWPSGWVRDAQLTIGDRVGLSNSTIVCLRSVRVERSTLSSAETAGSTTRISTPSTHESAAGPGTPARARRP